MKKALRLTLIASFTAGLCSAQQQVHILSLQDCINIALTRSTTVLKGNNNIAYAGAQVLAAYGQFLPNLTAGAGYNYDKGNNFYSSTGPTTANINRSAFNYQLTSSVNIFSGYYNYANWKAAKLNERVNDLTLQRAKEQIALDITQSYLQVILDKEIVVLDSNNLQTSLQREQQLTMLNSVGRVAKTELYQQQAQTSSDKLLFINAQNRMQNDKILLLQKLRIDSTDNYDIAPVEINDNAEIARYGNQDMLQQQALHDRIDILSTQLYSQEADFNIKKYRSGYLPKVALSAGVYNNGAYFNTLQVNGADQLPVSQSPIPNQLLNNTYGIIGLNASWNIFDNYYTKSNVQEAKIIAENARIDEQDTLISIVSEVKRAHNDYLNAVQQMETVNTGLTAAQKAYEAVNGLYKEGAADFITELNAQLALLQAQQNQAQASINMMLQKKVLDYYIGAN